MINNTTLKFASFRVMHGVYDEQKNRIDYQFYRVEGQRATDLNWVALSGRIEGEEVCKVYAEHLREELKNKGLVLDYCPIYNPGGYAYETRYQ